MSDDIDDMDIIDQMIRDLRALNPMDFREKMQVADRLTKLIGMKSRLGKKGRKGRGFDLHDGERTQ